MGRIFPADFPVYTLVYRLTNSDHSGNANTFGGVILGVSPVVKVSRVSDPTPYKSDPPPQTRDPPVCVDIGADYG